MYTKTHEWIRIEGDEATVGISKFAQSRICDQFHLDLPKEGTKCVSGAEPIGIIECGNWTSSEVALKDIKEGLAASMMCLEGAEQQCLLHTRTPISSPVDGVVKEVNPALQQNPRLLTDDPEGLGWLVKLKGISAPRGELLDQAAYVEYAQGRQ